MKQEGKLVVEWAFAKKKYQLATQIDWHGLASGKEQKEIFLKSFWQQNVPRHIFGMLPCMATNVIHNSWQVFSCCEIWVGRWLVENSQTPNQFVIWRIFFDNSALCTRAGETSRQAGAYFGCGSLLTPDLEGKSTWRRWQLFSLTPGLSLVCSNSFPSILECSALRHIFVFCPRRCSAPQVGLVSLAGGALLWKAVGGVGGDRWRDPGEFSPTRYYVPPAASYLRSVATLAPLVASSRTLSLGISAFWGDGPVLAAGRDFGRLTRRLSAAICWTMQRETGLTGSELV